MAVQHHDDEDVREQGTTGKAMKRRGILRAAGMALGALGAGVAAKQTSQPVAAATTASNFNADNPPGDANGLAYTNTTTGYSYGVWVDGSTAGVLGNTTSGDGVKGTTSTGHGVYGVAGNNGTGVRGEGTTIAGVTGVATTGYGVQGANNSANTPAIYGTNSNISGVAIHGENSTNTGTGVLGGRVNVSGNPFNGAGVYGKADGGHALHGEASSGWGLYATSTGPNPTAFAQNTGTGYGVYGKSTGNNAVYGECSSATASGVVGTNSNNGTGVYGYSGNGAGVYGSSNGSGFGVRGQISGASANTVAVRVENLSTGPGGYGVYATSAKFHGVYAECGTGQGAGALVGVTRYSTGVAFQAAAVSPATYAGFFTGTVSINGSLGVSGSKFAVVKGSDGQYRGMYAVESPECWFEDFGTGTLVNGTASVKLDPLFAQHVHTDSYHVFLTPHDGEHSLAVPARAGQSFSVEANPSANALAKGKKARDLNGTFSYRVVAKRNDIKGERMPVWEMPAGITIPDPPKVDPTLTAPSIPVPPASIPNPQPAPSPVAPPVSVSPSAPAPNPLPPSRP